MTPFLIERTAKNALLSPSPSHTSNVETRDFADQILGAFLICLGALLTVLGLNAMKFVGLQQQRKCTRRWMAAFFCWSIGQGTFIIASYFATVSVCAAVANIAAPFNAVIASRYFGEQFRLWPSRSSSKGTCHAIMQWDLFGFLLIAIGAALIVRFAPTPPEGGISYTVDQEVEMLRKPLALIALIVIGPGVILVSLPVSWFSGPGSKYSKQNRALAFGLICGAMGAHTFVATKLALMCDRYFVDSFWYLLCVWAGCCELIMIASLDRSLVALPKCSVIIISTYYISSTIFSSVVGLSTFNLFSKFGSPLEVILFVIGGLFCFAGVWIVSSKDENGEKNAGRMLNAVSNASDDVRTDLISESFGNLNYETVERL